MGRKGSGVEVREKSIRLTFTLADGTPERQTLYLNGEPLRPTPANVKYAHRIAAEIKLKIEAGMFLMADYFPHAATATTDSTVAGAIKHFKDSMRGEESTLKGYRSALKFWEAELGSKNFRALVKSDILKALKKRPNISGKTISNYVSVLRLVYQLLVDDKVLKENPIVPIEAPHQPPEVDPFTTDEAEAIIDRMRTAYDEQVYNYIECRFFTGARPSELAALKWPNVDLRSGYFLIEETIVETHAKDRTKTFRTRKVLLNSRSRAAIERQQAHTFMKDREGFVFIDPRTGGPWSRVDFFRRYYWLPTLQFLRIRYRKPYNTRHTYATMMLMAGMKPAFCAKQLGHDIKVFLETYSTWLDGDADELEMNRLEASFLPRKSPKTGTNGLSD